MCCGLLNESETWFNVFQFTASDNACCTVGDRIPFFMLVQFAEGYFFHFTSGVGSIGNYVINEPYELSQDYNVIIQQYENSQNIWKYEIWAEPKKA